jgi:hypothetical protein
LSHKQLERYEPRYLDLKMDEAGIPPIQ